MNEKIALIVNLDGSFEVRKSIDGGLSSIQISWAPDLAGCLAMASQKLNHPLVLKISGPDTSF